MFCLLKNIVKNIDVDSFSKTSPNHCIVQKARCYVKNSANLHREHNVFFQTSPKTLRSMVLSKTFPKHCTVKKNEHRPPLRPERKLETTFNIGIPPEPAFAHFCPLWGGFWLTSRFWSKCTILWFPQFCKRRIVQYWFRKLLWNQELICGSKKK